MQVFRDFSLGSVVAVAFVCGIGAAPASCDFTPTEQALIQGDLNLLCPQIANLDPTIRANFNGNVALALSSVELACPPNAPPTNISTIVVDLATVAVAMAPYIRTALGRLHASQAVSHAQTIATAHGLAITAPVLK